MFWFAAVFWFQDKNTELKNSCWKAQILLLLEEHGPKTYATTTVVVPTDAKQAEAYQKIDAKAKRIVMDGVKDHIVSLIAESDTCKKM